MKIFVEREDSLSLFGNKSKHPVRSSILNFGLNDFSRVSGLKLNETKTEAMWIGSSKTSKEKVCNLKCKLYPNNIVKSLGTHAPPGCMWAELYANLTLNQCSVCITHHT